MINKYHNCRTQFCKFFCKLQQRIFSIRTNVYNSVFGERSHHLCLVWILHELWLWTLLYHRVSPSTNLNYPLDDFTNKNVGISRLREKLIFTSFSALSSKMKFHDRSTWAASELQCKLKKVQLITYHHITSLVWLVWHIVGWWVMEVSST